MKAITPTRRDLKARDIPPSWQVELPNNPDAPVTVWISPAERQSSRRYVDFIGAGKGVYATRAEAEAAIDKLRDERRK